jgi:hypothetical protein
MMRFNTELVVVLGSGLPSLVHIFCIGGNDESFGALDFDIFCNQE